MLLCEMTEDNILSQTFVAGNVGDFIRFILGVLSDSLSLRNVSGFRSDKRDPYLLLKQASLFISAILFVNWWE